MADLEPNMTMSFTATVSRDLVIAAPLNTPTSVNIARNGQNARVTFSGTAGTSMAVQFGGVSTTPTGQPIRYTVLRPDGSTQYATYSTVYGTALNLPNLPTTGTYTLFVDPQYGVTANLTVNVATSANAAVAVDGSPGSFNTAALPGTAAYFSFTATAGENIGLSIKSLAKTNGHASYPYLLFYVATPDGTWWINGTQCQLSTSCEFNLAIPTTGVYAVMLGSPAISSEPTMTMSFTATVSRDLVVAAPLNTATPVSIARNGQNARVTFSGTAGTSMALLIGGVSTTPAGQPVRYTVLRPDGSTQFATYSTVYGTGFNLPNLPTTGTYTLYVDPQYGVTANLIVKPIPSNSVAIAVNGASSSVTIADTPGSNSYSTFTATAGENITFAIANLVKTNGHASYPYISIYVARPDGTWWVNGTQCQVSTGCTLNWAIPMTGVYSVMTASPMISLEPNMAMSFTATVTKP